MKNLKMLIITFYYIYLLYNIYNINILNKRQILDSKDKLDR